MESRINIAIDFNNGNLPVIQILQKSSEDVRDSIVSNFLQHLDHGSISRWLKIDYIGEQLDGHKWQISPIPSDVAELEKEAKLMQAVCDSLNSQLETQAAP